MVRIPPPHYTHDLPEPLAADTLCCRFVPEGHPTVFDITKRKIHNVLQGVAPKGVEMNDTDKNWFELWTQQNCASHLVSSVQC